MSYIRYYKVVYVFLQSRSIIYFLMKYLLKDKYIRHAVILKNTIEFFFDIKKKVLEIMKVVLKLDLVIGTNL